MPGHLPGGVLVVLIAGALVATRPAQSHSHRGDALSPDEVRTAPVPSATLVTPSIAGEDADAALDDDGDDASLAPSADPIAAIAPSVRGRLVVTPVLRALVPAAAPGLNTPRAPPSVLLTV